MATQPIERTQPESYIDDSQYERFAGVLSERPVPGLEHAALQKQIVDVLTPFAETLGGKVLQEWSISDGSGDWLTPDITFCYPDIKTTRRGHLLVPVYLVVEIRSFEQSLKNLFDKYERYRSWKVAHYWLIDPVEKACYECGTSGDLPVIVPRKDTLRAGSIEVEMKEILGN